MRPISAYWLVVGLFAALMFTQCSGGAEGPGNDPADENGIRQALINWYAAYSGTDEGHYRTFVADEYVLLENGVPMNLEDDLKAMRNRPAGYKRTDKFDFRTVNLYGEVASATYFLESQIEDDTKIQHRKWLESAVLRRIDGRWRAALLHSTRISATDTPRQ